MDVWLAGSLNNAYSIPLDDLFPPPQTEKYLSHGTVSLALHFLINTIRIIRVPVVA